MFIIVYLVIVWVITTWYNLYLGDGGMGRWLLTTGWPLIQINTRNPKATVFTEKSIQKDFDVDYVSPGQMLDL